jgi:RNA polymerase sigma-70 factor (sigma-E family)
MEEPGCRLAPVVTGGWVIAEGRHRGAVAGAGQPAVAHDLAAFCRQQHPRLVGTLGYYTGDPDLAEELAQDALLRACREWSRVATFEAPGAWVHRVAINLANSSFRRRAAKRRADRRADVRPDRHDDPDQAAAVALRSAISGLSDDMKAVIVLRYFADLSVRDVAVQLGMPEGTVKTHTSRAIDRLRRAGLGDIEVDDA